VLRFLVASAPVRDLFLFAKHKFVAARRHIVNDSFHPPPLPPQGYPLKQNQRMVRTAVRETKNVAQVKSRAVYRQISRNDARPLSWLLHSEGDYGIPGGPDGTHIDKTITIMNPINGELATDLHAHLENAPEEVARTELGGNPSRWLVGHDAHSRPRCGKSRPALRLTTRRAGALAWR
jgi:hypothetical protein